MGNAMKRRLSSNLGHPKSGVSGWFAMIMERNNNFLEYNAVRLCKIKPCQQVLEIGYGSGMGLKYACMQAEESGSSVFGIDISSYSLRKAQKRCKRYIKNNTLKIYTGSVAFLPYNTNTFDRVFHCNCYYFWSDLPEAVSEIYRVMKPNSVMVTTINLDSIKTAIDNGLLSAKTTDPVRYMQALEMVGFQDVKMEYLSDKGKNFQAMFAYVNNKSEIEVSEADLDKFMSKLKYEPKKLDRI